ncbi:MAG: mechanosensitive ion channel domain-containing protein [Candidatus Thiodiazotropha sp. 6PDIVS]
MGLKLVLVMLFLMMLSLPPILNAQASATEDLLTTLKSEKSQVGKSLDALNHSIANLEKIEPPDTNQKTELSWHYQTRDFLQKSLSAIDRVQDNYQAYQGVPLRLRRIEQELAKPLPTEHKVDDKLSLATLEQALETARTELETARKIRNEIEAEATQRSERLQKIADESANARKRQEELNQRLAAPATNGDKEGHAKQAATQAEQDYLKLFLIALEQEQRSYETRRELIRARRQQAERQILIAEQRFNAFEQRVNQQRITVATQAMQAADSAILAATSAHPLVRKIVDDNQQLAAELTQVSALSTSVSNDKKQLEETLSVIRRQYEGIKEKIAQIGLTDAIGLKLRSDRNQLPDTGSFETAMKKRRSDINRVQLRRIEIEDRLLELVDIKREALRQISAAGGVLSESENRALLNALQYALAEQREKYLGELIKAYDIYFEKQLFPMMEGERELVSLINEYSEFIDTRILWIQSSPVLAFEDIKRLGAAIPWLLNPAAMGQTASNLGNDLIDNPLATGTPLLIFALLVGFYRRLKEKLSDLGRYVTKLSKAKFTDTLLAAIVTALMVLPWPMLIYAVAWRTALSGLDNNYATALSSGLYSIAYLFFLGLLLRRICRPNGLGEAHFRWKTENLTLFRRQLTWFLPTALPMAFVVAATLEQPIQAHHDSLGRLAFVTLMLASGLFIYQLLKPSSGILKNEIAKHPGGWLERLSGVWFPLLVAAPLGLAMAAIIGYFYTAIQLCLYVVSTVGLIFSINVIREFFIRWLNITHRKLALEQWRKKLEAQAEAVDKNVKTETIEATPNEEPGLDVDVISTQTMRLLNSAYWLAIIIGIALIWSEVLPALNLLNEIVLWSSETISGDNVTTHIPTTLANVLLALAVLIMTLFISRNIPGLLEIAVLQHLPFTPSGRYAITTITRYLLVIVGLAMTFSAIGIGWSKVQWLAAAITVGLGFGLQEIFANFVSGLIILFERQIRVGDAVTVGNISGKVSRIQMRATTITDWDRKELIIPNKEFVTGQVINWSLSDTILRLLIPVGIAYGSDTKLAYENLLAAAHEHHNVLDDPEPTVRFVAFGESSLDFELRVYIPHPDLLLETKHELHMDIDQRFRDAEIEIAFPQRDIHIRDIPPTSLEGVSKHIDNDK